VYKLSGVETAEGWRMICIGVQTIFEQAGLGAYSAGCIMGGGSYSLQLKWFRCGVDLPSTFCTQDKDVYFVCGLSWPAVW
jgi:hypothetical protein